MARVEGRVAVVENAAMSNVVALTVRQDAHDAPASPFIAQAEWISPISRPMRTFACIQAGAG